ncbi:AI-2E family transporter [Butyrivibrio sp. AE2032]|uniref:AI-2E family transporter n=1 Tax=Butyrivibrio sp. AE2032 TaxID=1458463 RepID=UPI00054E6BA7|nr:AI-2E family transporter [Butyrivibrio sp. AE2032]
MVKYKERFSKYEKNRWTGLTISLCIVVVFYMLVSNIGSVKEFFNSFLTITSTVIIGAVFAYTVNPLAVFIYNKLKKLMKKSEDAAWIISASVSLIFVLGLVVGVLILLAPMLIDNITNFAMGLSGYMNSLKQLVMSTELDEDIKLSIMNFINEQSSLTAVVRKFVLGNDITPTGVLKFSADLGAGAFNFLIGIILAFYFLIGKKKLVELLSEFFLLVIPTKHYDNCRDVWIKFNSIFSRFIVCELIDAIIVGIVNGIFMFAMHMPYAVFCSFVVALCNLAPTFGPFVGAFICGVILLLAEPQFVIPFLVFTLALQLIDGYVIKPRLFGSALKVPAFLVLVFLVVGGKIWGVPGVLLAIPLAAILSYIYRQIAVPWLTARKKAKDEAEEKTESNAKAEAKGKKENKVVE